MATANRLSHSEFTNEPFIDFTNRKTLAHARGAEEGEGEFGRGIPDVGSTGKR